MSAMDHSPSFNFSSSSYIYDDENKNTYDDGFAEMPPTTETFIELAQRLGYQEDKHTAMIRTECMKTDYAATENITPEQGIASFEMLCAQLANQHEGTTERLIVKRGLRLSEASLYFHFKDYSQCINQLRDVYDDVCHESYEETDSCKEVSALIRHVAKRQIGHEVVSDSIQVAS